MPHCPAETSIDHCTSRQSTPTHGRTQQLTEWAGISKERPECSLTHTNGEEKEMPAIWSINLEVVCHVAIVNAPIFKSLQCWLFSKNECSPFHFLRNLELAHSSSIDANLSISAFFWFSFPDNNLFSWLHFFSPSCCFYNTHSYLIFILFNSMTLYGHQTSKGAKSLPSLKCLLRLFLELERCSAVKSTWGSCSGLEVSSKHPHWMVHNRP